MLPKDIRYGTDARERIMSGANKLANAVKTTLGPRGRNVMIDQGRGRMPRVTKDGVTVAREIYLKDMFENMGAQTLREVASKACDKAGDGPQPLWSKVLTPTGFVTMGEVEEGMEICGTNDSIQKVSGVYPKGEKEIYNVILSNGRTVQCCEDHLWSVTVNSGSKAGEYITLPLKDIVCDFHKVTNAGVNKFKYYVPVTSVEFYSNPDLMPLDPYLVGLLIGDGSLSGSGSVELSLGKTKEHILEKIKLPAGLTATAKYVDRKNYFRVKITGITPDGLRISDFLARIGLMGTTSDDKHIPRSYLYSSKVDREALLQGLLDTDGHINKRELFEFSTVSGRLAQDFNSLVLSLGKVVYSVVKNRDENDGSYSDKPIYRIVELKGYKHGIQIIGIEPTGNFTEMQCIKVSNPDNLYITDDFVVTHNTTTATVLAQAIFTEGSKAIAAGMNPIDLQRGVNKAVAFVVEKIKSMSRPIDEKHEWIQVATLSANGDKEIGEKIADAIERVGKEGVVTVEEGKGVGLDLEVVEGMRFDKGMVSPYFGNKQDKLECEFEDCLILLFDKKLSSQAPIVPLLEMAIAQNKPLLIIADDIEGEALNALVINRVRGGFRFCAVKNPGFGEKKREYLDDIAALTGAEIIAEDMGLTTGNATSNSFGHAKRVIVTKDDTTLVGGQGEKAKIEEHCSRIRGMIDGCENDYQKELWKTRLAKLTGGVAVIKVGGATEVEVKERRDRVDDAIHATRAAVEEGIVPGGGVALLYASHALETAVIDTANDDQEVGVAIIRKAIQVPLKTICSNAGVDGGLVAGKLIDNLMADDKHGRKYGFDAQELKYCNLMDAGIIDPTKVVRVALQDAASVAGLLITTECIITEHIEEKKDK